MFATIVVANDGSDGGFKALELACELAKKHRSALHMISVEEMPTFPASIDEVIELQALEDHKYHDVVAQARKIARATPKSSQTSTRPVWPTPGASPFPSSLADRQRSGAPRARHSAALPTEHDRSRKKEGPPWSTS